MDPPSRPHQKNYYRKAETRRPPNSQDPNSIRHLRTRVLATTGVCLNNVKSEPRRGGGPTLRRTFSATSHRCLIRFGSESQVLNTRCPADNKVSKRHGLVSSTFWDVLLLPSVPPRRLCERHKIKMDTAEQRPNELT